MPHSAVLQDVVDVVDRRFSRCELSCSPFPHVTLDQVFDDALAEDVLCWLERDAPWACESRDFYLQHGCAGLDERLQGTPAYAVASRPMIDVIRGHCERLFGTPLDSERCDVYAHRMLPGHRIGVHNDCPSEGTETHRLVVNFNRGFDDSCGGHLVLFAPYDPVGSAVIVRPRHNSGVAMMFSERSWHRVEEIALGVRYSLLYSFWPAATKQRASDSTQSPVLIDGFSVPNGLPEASADRLRRALEDTLAAIDLTSSGTSHTTYATIDRWGSDIDSCKAALLYDVFGTTGMFPRLSQEIRERLRDCLGERAYMLAELADRFGAHDVLRLRRTGMTIDRDRKVAVRDLDQRALVALFWSRAIDGGAGALPVAGFDVTGLLDVTAACLTPSAMCDIAARVTGAQGQHVRPSTTEPGGRP
jgi:hypothetical protein